MAAAHYKLDNLTAIVDYNRLQLDGTVAQIMELAPFADKWRAFGWRVLEINGHAMAEILGALATAQATSGCPTVIIAHTVKGKGVSFMENQVKWHAGTISDEQLRQALVDLACEGGIYE
jgi:transketolase